MDGWPDCPVEGCTNKICPSLNSDKCFPHTPGNEHVKRWKIDARNAPRDETELLEALASVPPPSWFGS